VSGEINNQFSIINSPSSYGAHAHRCGAPLRLLAATPIATPLQKAAALKGPAFCFLNYESLSLEGGRPF